MDVLGEHAQNRHEHQQEPAPQEKVLAHPQGRQAQTHGHADALMERRRQEHHEQQQQPARDGQNLDGAFDPREPIPAPPGRDPGSIGQARQDLHAATDPEQGRQQRQEMPAGIPANAGVAQSRRQRAQLIDGPQRQFGQEQPVQEGRGKQRVQEAEGGRPHQPGRPPGVRRHSRSSSRSAFNPKNSRTHGPSNNSRSNAVPARRRRLPSTRLQ